MRVNIWSRENNKHIGTIETVRTMKQAKIIAKDFFPKEIYPEGVICVKAPKKDKIGRRFNSFLKKENNVEAKIKPEVSHVVSATFFRKRTEFKIGWKIYAALVGEH